METTTGTHTEAVPRGWPPEQPVSLVTVRLAYLRLALALFAALLVLVAWDAWEQRLTRVAIRDGSTAVLDAIRGGK